MDQGNTLICQQIWLPSPVMLATPYKASTEVLYQGWSVPSDLSTNMAAKLSLGVTFPDMCNDRCVVGKVIQSQHQRFCTKSLSTNMAAEVYGGQPAMIELVVCSCLDLTVGEP